jgi:AAHS family 4-hydroxybenzoate transporter-like MFS transporter
MTNLIDVRQLINSSPISRWQKLIFGLCFFAIALDGMDITLMGFIAPELKRLWAIDNAALGHIMSAALIGLACGAMISGPLSDRFGRRRVILFSVFFFAFWTLLAGFAETSAQITILRFFAGLGLGASMPNISTLVAEYAPEKHRSFIISMVFCGFTFGASMGGLISSWMIVHWGWHSVLFMGGAFPLLLLPVLFLLLPESAEFLVLHHGAKRRVAKLLKHIAPGVINDDSEFTLSVRKEDRSQAIRLVLSRVYLPGSMVLWAANFCAMFAVYMLGSWLPTLVKEVQNDVAFAAIVTTNYQAGGMLGSLCVGWLMDRYNPHYCVGGIFFLGALATASMGMYADHQLFLCLTALAAGFCLNGANTGMNALSAAWYPTSARATGSSWMQGIGRLGAITSTIAGATVVSLGLNFSATFMLLAFPAVMTASLVLVKNYIPAVARSLS